MPTISAAQTIPAPAQAASIVSTLRISAAQAMEAPTQAASLAAPIGLLAAQTMAAPTQAATVRLLSGLWAVQRMAEPTLGAALTVTGSPTPQNPSGLALAWSDSVSGDVYWTETAGGLAALDAAAAPEAHSMGGAGMLLRQITPPADEPISLVEARSHLRVTTSADDTLIEAYIAAAREAVEAQTGRAVMPQVWELTVPRWPNRRGVELPIAPLLEVQSVTYRGLDGVDAVLDPAAYVVMAPSGPRCMPGRLLLASGSYWPAVRGGDAGAIRIRYRVGYEPLSAVPAAMRAAILLYLGELYEGREASVPTRGGAPQSLSDNPAVKRLLTPLTIWEI